jgi:hypothetical protein
MDFLTFPIIAILSIFGLGLYTGYDSIVFDPISSPKWIPLANSLCGFRYHEGSECRLASLGTRFTDQPAIDAAQVDGGGDQEMLQMRLRRSDITRAPQIESPDAL